MSHIEDKHDKIFFRNFFPTHNFGLVNYEMLKNKF